MIRAVLDTNVLASGFAGEETSTSTPGSIVRHWRHGHFELVVSAHIFTELGRTFAKPYFRSRRSGAQTDAAILAIVAAASFVVPTVKIYGVATHPEDDVVLATAVTAEVDYLVTGDKQLQRLETYQGVAIVSPRQFLTLLEQNRAEA